MALAIPTSIGLLSALAVAGGNVATMAVGCATLAIVVVAVVVGRGGSLAYVAFLASWSLVVFTAEIGGSVGGASVAKLAPLALMMMMTFVLYLQDGTQRSAVLPTCRVACWYVAWLAVCIPFAELPMESGIRVLQTALPLASACIVARSRYDGRWLIWATAVPCLGHVVAGLAAGSYVGPTDQLRLTGLVIANTYALAAAIGLTAVVAGWQARVLPSKSRWLVIPVLVVCLVGIERTVGRTAVIAVPFGLLVPVVLRGRRHLGSSDRSVRTRQLLPILAVFVAIGFLLERVDDLRRWYTTGNVEVTTLTGRTVLWEQLVGLAAERPLFGYGPGAMRFGAPSLRSRLGEAIELSQAHNSLMEAMVNSGLIGALLWVGVMATTWRTALSSSSGDRAFLLPQVAMLSAYSLTLGNMSGFGIGWYALVAVMCALDDHRPRPEMTDDLPATVDVARGGS